MFLNLFFPVIASPENPNPWIGTTQKHLSALAEPHEIQAIHIFPAFPGNFSSKSGRKTFFQNSKSATGNHITKIFGEKR